MECADKLRYFLQNQESPFHSSRMNDSQSSIVWASQYCTRIAGMRRTRFRVTAHTLWQLHFVLSTKFVHLPGLD